MALTKANIIEAIAEANGHTRNRSIEVTESLLEIMKRTLEGGEDLLVSGFGKFQVKHKEERRGRNPSTGSNLTLRPRKVVTFKFSGKLRDKINNG